MDRYEITNRQYKAFVDAGGYVKRDYWQEPFAEAGHTISWEDAMTRFLDRTGRAGPSTWELGTYADGHADFPVGGVSWYEAAAYAVFAGKSLPTVYQWRMSADFSGPSGVFGDILVHSTFNAKGPTAVGTLNNIGPYGQYDMAGNVKEWCWNESRDLRMILGGGFSDPKYTYEDRDAQPPFSRVPTHGIRLVKNIDPQPPMSFGPMPRPARDYSVEKPIDDAAFAIVKGLPTTAGHWQSSTTSGWPTGAVRPSRSTPYGNSGSLPTVLAEIGRPAIPDGHLLSRWRRTDVASRPPEPDSVVFVIRSGRALVYRLQGTFERAVPLLAPTRVETSRSRESRTLDALSNTSRRVTISTPTGSRITASAWAPSTAS